MLLQPQVFEQSLLLFIKEKSSTTYVLQYLFNAQAFEILGEDYLDVLKQSGHLPNVLLYHILPGWVRKHFFIFREICGKLCHFAVQFDVPALLPLGGRRLPHPGGRGGGQGQGQRLPQEQVLPR